jgi:hypothetical protein
MSQAHHTVVLTIGPPSVLAHVHIMPPYPSVTLRAWAFMHSART